MNAWLRWCVAVLAITCFGCTSNAPSDEKIIAGLNTPTEGGARIVLFRTRDSGLYLLRSAGITVNDVRVGTVSYGSFNYFEVPANSYDLSAGMWDVHGSCRLTLNAESGATYYFQVDPRAESFASFAAGDFALSLVTNQVVSIAGGVAASSLESYGRTCGGAFKLYPVDPATALSRLAELKQSSTCCKLDDQHQI